MQSITQKRERAIRIIKNLRMLTREMERPASDQIVARYGKDPYLILISCLLSLRARDVVSLPVSCLLFEQVRTPEQMLAIPISELERILKPIGFFRQKARQVKSVSRELIERFHGRVPHIREELLSIKGIGPKTASLVLAQAFGVPAICVDTHVHRLANHLGLVHTKKVEETERELAKLLPKRYWREINTLLVMWGQNVCKSSKTCKCAPIISNL